MAFHIQIGNLGEETGHSGLLDRVEHVASSYVELGVRVLLSELLHYTGFRERDASDDVDEDCVLPGELKLLGFDVGSVVGAGVLRLFELAFHALVEERLYVRSVLGVHVWNLLEVLLDFLLHNAREVVREKSADPLLAACELYDLVVRVDLAGILGHQGLPAVQACLSAWPLAERLCCHPRT